VGKARVELADRESGVQKKRGGESSICLEIDLRQAIYALTDALDLVGVDEVGHGKRVGFMALECARVLPFEEEARLKLFHAALLHDCGVSSTRVHRHLVEELEWDNAEEHCRVGAALLRRFAPLAPLAPVIRYHHQHWDGLGGVGISEEDALFANLIFLVDRVDALTAPHYGKDLLLVRHAIRERIAGYRGTLFAPELVDAFLQVSAAEAFWLSMEPPHLERFLFEMEREHLPLPIGLAELKQLAQMFANIVDAKSHFTVEHSNGVARLARYLAEKLGLPQARCDMLEVAGLLHDLGKLRVPDEILDKPGPMDERERAVMLRHSFESYQILRRIKGLEEIALWAAYHHEMPAGHGYPFHASSGELGKEARIIAVADVFQALAQNRPYRDGLSSPRIVEMLQEQAAAGHLDREIVALVAKDPEGCWQQATLPQPNPEA
jgi:putative nucleotidyltransferase with HDIG domain